jgi:hypothetical protein
MVQMIEEGRVLEAERLWVLRNNLLLVIMSVIVVLYFGLGVLLGMSR